MKDKLIFNNKMEVRSSPIHGYGVFAKEDIKAGEILEEIYF
jgi:SET domain-containing protein